MISTYIHSFENLVLFAVVIISVWMAFMVLQSEHKSATNWIYFILNIATVAWLISAYVIRLPELVEWQLTLARLGIFFAAPMSAAFLLLAHTVPSRKILLNKGLFITIIFSTVAMMGLNISPYAFTGVEVTTQSVNPIPGFGILPFAVLSTLFSMSAIFILIRKLRKSTGQLKNQLGYILSGIVVMLSLITFTVLVPIIYFSKASFLPLVPVYTLIFLALTAYSITKHQLFNVKILVTQSLAFILWSVLFANIFTSQTLETRITDIAIFAFSVVFGVLLIKSVLREVEARKQIEQLAQDLEKANIRLKQLDKLKSEFVSIASHQLRTPLTAIKGYASLILEGSFGNISKGVEEAIQKIFDSSKLMTSSIQDFLDVSRIEQGKMKYNFEIFDAKKLLRIVVEEQQNTVKEKGLVLTLDSNSKEIYNVRADYGKLKQIFSNLIDNSIKYTPRGAIKIRIEKTQNNKYILISVSDTGVGISHETLARLFDKFVRADNAHEVNVSGSGLGLYVVRQMVEAHKGKVWAESEGENKGSTFYVQLDAH